MCEFLKGSSPTSAAPAHAVTQPSRDVFLACTEPLISPTETIIQFREEALTKIFKAISKVIKQYQGSKAQCTLSSDQEEYYIKDLSSIRTACDTVVLGSLNKGLEKIGLWPIPEPPFSDMTFLGIRAKLRSLDVISLCGQLQPRSIWQPEPKQHVSPVIKVGNAIFMKLRGLDIDAFKGKPQQ